ncbi:MAG: class I SAM-dependent methyltransferase [Candidatus Promineifilaceae bacterium]
MIYLFLLILLLLVAAVFYWLIIVTEGVYLGRRVVVWLYDITAHKYDGIKQFNPPDEQFTITQPLLEQLGEVQEPLILDVATGSGRVPFNLLSSSQFHGRIIGLDASQKMLDQAAAKLVPFQGEEDGRYLLVQQTAAALPFANQTFHAVTCLEALEFFPSDAAALKEMVRVLRPGGFLMTSRRKGWEGKAFLGRYRSSADFKQLLDNLGLVEIRSHLWELNYDMITARKRDDWVIGLIR